MTNRWNIWVFAFLSDDQGRILLVKRNYGDRTWALPWWTIESKEGVLEALSREIEEEIGITVSKFEFRNVCFSTKEYSIAISFSAHLSKDHVCSLGLQATSELEDMRFFSSGNLPSPLNEATFEKIRNFYAKNAPGFLEINAQSDGPKS